MNDTNDTIDGLLAEFRGYAAGMPPSYHVTMSWADFRRMLDRFDAAHKRERGDAAKLREAVKCLMENLNIHLVQPSDLITVNRAELDGMVMVCEKALSAPPRNCDIGSAEEQWRRFCDIEAPTCRAEDVCHCRTAARCFAEWAQRPYKEGGDK